MPLFRKTKISSLSQTPAHPLLARTANSSPVTGSVTGTIKVLGMGCRSCQTQYENALAAVANMGLPFSVEHITDPRQVMDYGVMSMPALVLNNTVLSMGRVLSPAEVEALLHRAGC